MIEVWKAVVGFEGYYEVSDQGRVRSLDHVVSDIHRNGKPRVRQFKGRVLKAGDNGHGYLRLILEKDRRRFGRQVHRLVLEAFIGACPPGKEGAHENGDSEDNRLTNLEWKTPVANHFDRWAHGTRLRSGWKNHVR